jgi:hypothetical protein
MPKDPSLALNKFKALASVGFMFAQYVHRYGRDAPVDFGIACTW